jgi:hypothetical protein
VPTALKPIERGSRAAWLISAASLGAVAGLPWIFILQGPLVSALFALVAGLRANQLWQHSKRRSVGWLFAVVVMASAIALGHPASSTWPDRCFVLYFTGGDPALNWLRVMALVGTAALVCLALVERELRRRLRRLRALGLNQPEAAGGLTSFWVGLAGLAWSVTNEALFPALLNMLIRLADRWSSTYNPDPFTFRDPCNPEVGWIGACLYALALVMLWRDGASKASAAIAEAPWHRRLLSVRGAVLILLFVAQGARTFVLLRRELPMLAKRGGAIECECFKYEHSSWHVM